MHVEQNSKPEWIVVHNFYGKKNYAFSHNSLLKDCKKAKFAMKEEIYLLFYNDNLKCELKLNVVQRDGG